MIIRCQKIYSEEAVVDGFLVVEAGKIKAIEAKTADLKPDIDVPDKIIIPGLIDTHNHGTMGYAIVQGLGEIQPWIAGYLKGLASQGVTGIFPTFKPDVFCDIVQGASADYPGAKIVGIHSEGPYLSRVGENDIDQPHPDITMDFVKKMVDDGQGLLKLVALAPEIPLAAEAIHYFVDQGIRVAFAHSDCDYHDAMASFKEGISVATHTANVMSGIHHRRMGGLGACLLDENLWCEIIADGLHVCDEMMELMFKVKDYDKYIMVSDNTPIAGAPLGRYDLMGYQVVNVDERGFCLNDTGALCGSSKPLIYGVNHLVNALNIPLETCLKMAALNPAIAYGFNKEKGSLKVGKDADFVLIDKNFEVWQTFVEGNKVYDRESDTDLFNQLFLQMCKVN